MSAANVEQVSFPLLNMGWSVWTGHIPAGERVSWLRDQLASRGFGIESTVNNCGSPLPPGLAHKLDNDEPRFMAECADKGIEVITTGYAITFKKGGAA
jgi:hypothetical protein